MLSMVEGGCDLGEAYLLQEGDFTTALSQATQYRVENGQSELFTNPGEQLLFVPVGAEVAPPFDMPYPCCYTNEGHNLTF